MLQIIENFYLALLRLSVILSAGLLLLSALTLAVVGVNALREPVPGDTPPPPSTNPEALKGQLLNKEPVAPKAAASAAKQSRPQPAQADLKRATDALVSFVRTHSDGSEGVDPSVVGGIVRELSVRYEEQGLAAVHAKQFADAMEKILKDPAVIADAKQRKPVTVINDLIRLFDAQFEASVNKAQEQQQTRRLEAQANRAQGEQLLYIAGGVLGTFFVVVFMSIAIRIERNLRPLERIKT